MSAFLECLTWHSSSPPSLHVKYTRGFLKGHRAPLHDSNHSCSSWFRFSQGRRVLRARIYSTWVFITPITRCQGWMSHSSAPLPHHGPACWLNLLDHAMGGHKACSAMSLPSRGHKEMLSGSEPEHMARAWGGQWGSDCPAEPHSKRKTGIDVVTV